MTAGFPGAIRLRVTLVALVVLVVTATAVTLAVVRVVGLHDQLTRLSGELEWGVRGEGCRELRRLASRRYVSPLVT